MKININIIPLSLLLIMIFSINMFAQSRPYEGPDDPAGDIAAERTGWMSGNRVLMFYRNTTEIADHQTWFVNKWPNTLDGTKMHDGICLLIGARVFLENDSIPVTNLGEIATRTDLDTLYYCQSSYREHMDKDPTGTIEWGLYPVFGYFNELSETPAMSNLPESWPPLGWPAFGDELIWPKEWNGRFGRGVMKADQECYFVVNDAHDQEYLGAEDTVKYYPRRIYGSNGEVFSDVKIGDKKTDVTIQKGLPWGGLGIRVQARGFQWSHPAVQDAIFWEYGIANVSEYDLPNMYFGLYTDNAVGGESSDGADDIAYYNLELNMCYSWDLDGIPVGGGKAPGVYGLAFLESPGIIDGEDNDRDGLIDERRDNDATQKIGPYEGISNLADFLNFYSLSESDLKEHWDADEDQDWSDWKDTNGNGKYDDGEDLGDDVGLDGVGPSDLNYFGPDEDGTEANHRPDRKEGIAEPNFAETDISESDMVGLGSFKYIFNWGRDFFGVGGDENLWHLHTEPSETNLQFAEAQMEPRNFVEQFASGVFELKKGLTERISMSELHAYENLSGLNSEEHKAPALFELKRLVQLIYETDYRFAQPPLMPTMVANPSDGKVYLSWDDKADIFTREAFAKNVNDFEGYKLYRSTDPYLEDATTITNGFGSPTLKDPIFECDIIDDRKGFANYGTINGIQYWLGDDSGIRHSFIDSEVQNGRTYYYVLVAYDYGLPDREIGPTENTFILEIDENENIRRVSPNVAVVKPHQFSAGYPNAGEANIQERTTAANFIKFDVDLFDPNKIKNGHTYKLKLDVHADSYAETNERLRSPYDIKYYNDGIRVYNVTEGDSLVYHETRYDLSGTNFDTLDVYGISALTNEREIVTNLIEGLRLRMRLIPLTYPELNEENTGWVEGESNMNILLGPKYQYFPWHYEIVWNEPGVYDTTRTNFILKKLEDYQGNEIAKANTLLDQQFNFHILNKTFLDSTGNYPKMDLLVHDINGNGVYDWKEDQILVGDAKFDVLTKLTLWTGTILAIDFSNIASEDQLPKPNDVYRIDFKRGFHDTDSIMFTVTGITDELDADKLAEDMENIKVVPNPYVMTNTMEGAVANWQRNQKRQIMFTHIPAQCKISIFTLSGVLVDEIDVDNSVAQRENSWDLNSEANGTAHWDLRSSEGLEIAAGYYLYHVESKKTGDVKIGKFAIIK
ncbi:MAG: hypothetical protein KDC88_03955 [Ignavibacteriae bacterium]|nr:hypothetical protein [Ignavibacteriota bacterium]MCB9218144.1 hypothetical protein [Ignavibacteriales bacterium]MCB9260533.1 hypothetical protein [Ignavibacteriales bacterium]